MAFPAAAFPAASFAIFATASAIVPSGGSSSNRDNRRSGEQLPAPQPSLDIVLQEMKAASEGDAIEETGEEETLPRIPIGKPKTPLVLHFNSHDGKEMMRTLTDALKERAAHTYNGI